MAGKLTANTLQLGDSATASQNFHIVNNVDGSMSINRGNTGSSLGEVFKVTSDGLIVGAVKSLGTVSLSGSSTLLTSSIPASATWVELVFNQVSLSASANLLLQIGSGSIVTTGYDSSSGNRIAEGASTSGLLLTIGSTAAALQSGVVRLVKTSGNTWAYSGLLSRQGAAPNFSCGLSPTLSGPLTSIQLTSTSTDTFDNGSVTVTCGA